MSNIIDFEQLGGFRLEQPTLAKMQETTYVFIKAMIGHFGIPDIGNFIISGCNISGENITEGILYINGNVCPFETAVGTLDSKIIKVVTNETLEFQNGTTPPVFKKYTAAINDLGTPLSEFVRVPSPFYLPEGTVIDPNYLAFTQAMLDKLNGIEEFAEVNVQTDLNETNPASDAYLKGKQPGTFLMALHKNTVIVGNVTNSQVLDVDGFDVGTNNYMVVGALRGYSSIADKDNDVTYNTFDHTPTSFKLTLDQHSDQEQNIRFNFIIIAL